MMEAGVKSVLLYVQDDEGLDSRFEAALALATVNSGHLTCMQVTPSSAYVAFDGFGGVFIMADVMNRIEERRAAVKAEVEAKLKRADIGWDFIDCTDAPVRALVARSALADVVVLSRSNEGPTEHDALSLAGDVAIHARTPVLVVPTATKKFNPFGRAMIAWNGSFEAANALRAALPLLKKASDVQVVTVEEPGSASLPSTSAAEYLARHDVPATVQQRGQGPLFPEEALQEVIDELNPSYLVMGAYGHSRAREFVFGGVTRAMLKNSSIPLLLGH
jgi:nucleotide-binding universal stress UspA family protein